MNFIRKIIGTTLFKITSLNSFSVLLKISTGLIASKVLAIFVGPSGMALVGNMRNFFTSLENVSTLGFQNGIVKYVAENQKNTEELKKIMATVFISFFFIALILSGVLYFFASYWSDIILGFNSRYALVFKVLALVLPWYTISVFLLSFLNGLSKFKKVIWVNIIGNVAGLLVSVAMIIKLKILGALLVICIAPSLLFFITFYFVQKEINLLETIRFRFYEFKIIKELVPYSVMALFSSVLGPIVFLAIRNNVIEKLGINQAGFWETITRISSNYMLFITTILVVYFLPKLARAKNSSDTKAVFLQFYKYILPVFILGVIVIYFSRFYIVQLLLTKEFLPVTSLFFWQLVGDIFKVCSLILGYQFFAKKLTTSFIISESLSLASLYFLSLFFINHFEIEGVVMAQAFNNFLYLVGLCLYFRKSLF